MTHRYWEEYSLDFTVCSQQHQQEEIDFLVQKFVDNGDQKHELFRILNKFQRKTSNPPPPTPSENTDQTQIVVLPWVPGLSNNHHRVWMDDFKILGSCYKSNFKRKISEALFIEEKKPDINVQKLGLGLQMVTLYITFSGTSSFLTSFWNLQLRHKRSVGWVDVILESIQWEQALDLRVFSHFLSPHQ